MNKIHLTSLAAFAIQRPSSTKRKLVLYGLSGLLVFNMDRNEKWLYYHYVERLSAFKSKRPDFCTMAVEPKPNRGTMAGVVKERTVYAKSTKKCLLADWEIMLRNLPAKYCNCTNGLYMCWKLGDTASPILFKSPTLITESKLSLDFKFMLKSYEVNIVADIECDYLLCLSLNRFAASKVSDKICGVQGSDVTVSLNKGNTKKDRLTAEKKLCQIANRLRMCRCRELTIGSCIYVFDLVDLIELFAKFNIHVVNIVPYNDDQEPSVESLIANDSECLMKSPAVKEKKALDSVFGVDGKNQVYSTEFEEIIEALEKDKVSRIVVVENIQLNRVIIQNIATGEKRTEFVRKGAFEPTYNADKEFVAEEEVLLKWLVENYEEMGFSLQLITNNVEGQKFVARTGGLAAVVMKDVENVEDVEDVENVEDSVDDVENV